LPDLFREPHRAFNADAATRYAAFVIYVIEELRKKDLPLAGFIAESMPSVGGQIVLPSGYLNEVYEAVRKAGGVCIADEVQTGYGRVGTHFWAFESYGVVPDIVVLGKPIGNGHPIGAVVTTPEIAASFDNGMEFFSTFGGNPVSCAIGLAVLDEVSEKNLQGHALAVGELLLKRLNELMVSHELIGDVRGSGLFIGAELVRDRTTLEPATEEANIIVNAMRERQILFGTDGQFHNVLKIRPPMPFDESDADRLCETLASVFSEM
jgi:4-aminobutyrate aminotransferase-like enzyme